MQAEYKREISHTFLILRDEEDSVTDSYTVRMLLSGQIEGLLPCEQRGLNGDPLFFYEITSKQNLVSYYENKKLGYEDLQIIFSGLVKMLELLEEHLLSEDWLLLNPRYIYREPEKGVVYFCFLPWPEGNFQNGLRTLAEYFLPRLDHQDNQAVIAGYGIYKESMEETLNIEAIKKFLYLPEKESKAAAKTESERMPELFAREEEIRKQAMDAFFEDEDEMEEKNPGLKIAGCILTLSASAAILFLLFHYRLATVEQILWGIGIIFAAGTLAALLWFLRRNRGAIPCADLGIEEEEKKMGASVCEILKERKEMGKEIEEEEIEEEETVLLYSASSREGNACLRTRIKGETIEYPLDKEIILIGKLPSAADICIPYPEVSRIHGKIRHEKEKDYLSDLHSKNGIRINERLLEPEKDYLLKADDTVQIGNIIFQYLPSTCCTKAGKAI